MTSAPITEMPATGYAVQPSGAAAKTQSTPAFADSLGQAGKQTTQSAGQSVQKPTGDRQEDAVKSADRSRQAGGRQKIKEADHTMPEKKVTDQKAMEALSEQEKQIAEKIAEQFDVSEEEVLCAMQLLGLDLTDLLMQGNMAMLVSQLTGTDSVELLTNETLFSQMTMLSEEVDSVMQELAEELGMSVGEMKELLMSKENPELIADMGKAVETDMAVSQEAMQEEHVAGEAQAHAENGESRTPVYVAPSEEESAGTDTLQTKTQEDVTAENVQTGKEEAFTEEKESDEKSTGGQQEMQNGISLEQKTAFVQQAEGKTDVQRFEQQLSMQRTREIIDQIADYVKIHNSARSSSMEIQLNPANLGTVNLQVASKNGVISAQFYVQDDAVRAALESQTMQLRESLEAQGLKVDAVEVTVASHAFEQNLDQQGRQEEEKLAAGKKTARKLLNLDELPAEGEEAAEEISDADRLQIEMMRMGGNKLNFRV